MVPALLPSRRPLPAPPGQGLPVTPLTTPAGRSSTACYALTSIDGSGRVADRSLVQSLGWRPGHPVELTVLPQGAVLVAGGADSQHAITGQGHLRLPATVRHASGLATGDRLLLAAHRDRQIVLAYPMAALDAMIRAWHTCGGIEHRR